MLWCSSPMLYLAIAGALLLSITFSHLVLPYDILTRAHHMVCSGVARTLVGRNTRII